MDMSVNYPRIYKLLFDVQYFDYICNCDVTYVIEAENKAEAKTIAWAACSPYIAGHHNFDPGDFIAWEHSDTPAIYNKDKAIERVSESRFNEAYAIARKDEEE